MIDETEKVISSKEREKQIEENKEVGITITHHDRREHYSKILGSKQVFAIAINHHYDENKTFETIWTTPEKFVNILNKYRDELKVYDRPTYIN